MTSLCTRKTLAGFCRICKRSTNKKLIFGTIFQFQNKVCCQIERPNRVNKLCLNKVHPYICSLHSNCDKESLFANGPNVLSHDVVSWFYFSWNFLIFSWNILLKSLLQWLHLLFSKPSWIMLCVNLWPFFHRIRIYSF